MRNVAGTAAQSFSNMQIKSQSLFLCKQFLLGNFSPGCGKASFSRQGKRRSKPALDEQPRWINIPLHEADQTPSIPAPGRSGQQFQCWETALRAQESRCKSDDDLSEPQSPLGKVPSLHASASPRGQGCGQFHGSFLRGRPSAI